MCTFILNYRRTIQSTFYIAYLHKTRNLMYLAFYV